MESVSSGWFNAYVDLAEKETYSSWFSRQAHQAGIDFNGYC